MNNEYKKWYLVLGMFENTGYNAMEWSIGNLSGWDVSNVTGYDFFLHLKI